MPWYEKEHTTAFDSAPPNGLYFLIGDLLAKRYNQDWIQGKKYPVISYPSGLQKELWNSSDDGDIITVFGALELLRQKTRDEGFTGAIEFASEYGYTVARRGENELLILNQYSSQGYVVTYDNRAQLITNVKRFPQEAMEILDAESRAVLPELYSKEQLGLDAVAPVKIFTPDGNWAWYPTEYDGEDTFFGLVSGFEVELGYFSLTELEGVRGNLGLPVERDLYFTPTTLRELQKQHES
ncbi:MAG: DUF2958 domain-containing protein [Chloroflexi bacterium]|nr:DUF2958 domain-containing protein [Chloroflexota bacterium]